MYFGQFLGLRVILVIFMFRGVFWSFLGLGGILVIFRFREYFGQFFLGFEGILVIFSGFCSYLLGWQFLPNSRIPALAQPQWAGFYLV